MELKSENNNNTCWGERIREIVLQIVPRILGFVDRDPGSRTFGCCDRYYWHYRLHDLPNARFQEVSLLLALLYSHDFPGNIYFRNEKVFEWILAIIENWRSGMNRDGSVSEVYPYERSYCATAFSSFAATESLLLLSNDRGMVAGKIDAFMRDHSFKDTLKKTGRWLAKDHGCDVSNQTAASMLSLFNISALTEEESFRNEAERKFYALQSSYSEYGYVIEYGGLDIGYSSITISCLGWYSKKTSNRKVVELMSLICDSLNALINDSGQYDHTKTSRNTQFLYPFGFFSLQSDIFKKILNGVMSNRIITPNWLDDRYCIAMAIDYAKTCIEMFNARTSVGKESCAT